MRPEYHFKSLRLHVNPQTRLSSEDHSPGFTSIEELKKFCDSIGFYYAIFSKINGEKMKQVEIVQ